MLDYKQKLKKALITLLVVFYFVRILGQNLVENPSFETFSNCPNYDGQIFEATSWLTPTTGTSDYFNICAGSSCSSLAPYICIPTNWTGNEIPHTGNAYAGLFAYWDGEPNYREYIQTELATTCIAGSTYEVTFYLSLGDQSQNSTDNIGIYFSNTPINQNNFLNFAGYSPQVSTSNTIINKNGWTQITGFFVASGGEKFITIGNFNDDSNTNLTTVVGGSTLHSYYYIDDISIESKEIILEMPNIFTPNSDGINDFFLPSKINGINNAILIIYNRWGQKIIETNNLLIGWNGEYNGKYCTDGVYYWFVQYTTITNESKNINGFLTLIK